MDGQRRAPHPFGYWTTSGLILLASGIGLGIAAIDSGPGWDDTGITVGLLVLGAGAVAALAGRWPWLWAILVGAPTPIVEIASTGNTGSVIAVAFAAIGAGIGWAIRHGSRGADGPASG